MDLSTITVSDFKGYFARDFAYLPEWSITKIYNLDAVVYYTSTELFYRAKQNGVPVGTVPTNATYWEVVSDDVYNYILDADITKAFAEAQMNLNQPLFSTDADIKVAYYYMSAHYLVMDTRGAQAGIESTERLTWRAGAWEVYQKATLSPICSRAILFLNTSQNQATGRNSFLWQCQRWWGTSELLPEVRSREWC